MCLAIYKPGGVIVPSDAYRNGFASNSHGAGFSYVEDGKLVTVKGLFTFDDFWRAFQPHENKQAIVHFRFATSGLRDNDNCHPFEISSDTAMIHNGVLSIERNVNPDRSDTWHYCELVLRPFAARDPNFFVRPDVVFMGEAAIGHDKFCFLRADGQWAIWNEGRGEWDGDAWFSNTSYADCYVRYDAAPAAYHRKWWVEDGRIVSDEPERADEGRYYQYLDRNLRFAYADMLEDGFTVEELDTLIETEGEEALLEYVNFTYEER